MRFFLDPSGWIDLLTLIILEIILGVDNLIFISILAEKLSPLQRNKARLTGLLLSFFIRIALLSLVSSMITLTHPIIQLQYFNFSTRGILLLFGGTFLLFKSTTELHERLKSEPIKKNDKSNKNYANFWTTILQIVLLDSVFSFDSIITAVGVVHKLSIMIMAISCSMMLIIFSSKSLSEFINSRPTTMILCLGFLLIVGVNLLSESFGFFMPKGYLYTAIGFATVIEIFNFIKNRNNLKYESSKPLRQRAVETICSFASKDKKKKYSSSTFTMKKLKKNEILVPPTHEMLEDEEKHMIKGVLALAFRSIKSIMTPRSEISWINIHEKKKKIKLQLLNTPHSLFPVCQGELDDIIGIVRAKELLVKLDQKEEIYSFVSKIPPIIVPDTLDPINLLGILKRSKGSCVIINNEFGIVQGLITPLDMLEAIAGEFPDADETPDIVKSKNGWLAKGTTNLHSLEQFFNIENISNLAKPYASLAGLLIAQNGKLPEPGDIINIASFSFCILKTSKYKIDLVQITKQPKDKII